MQKKTPVSSSIRVALLLVFCGPLWSLVSTATVVEAGEEQARYFNQLRSRRLFSLAERYCFEKLAQDELPPRDRIDFAYELSRTLAAHALTAQAAQQADLWNRAAAILLETRSRVGGHERRVYLDLQAGFVACAYGESLRWQSELSPDDASLRSRAIQELDRGINQLQLLEPELQQRLTKPPPKGVRAEDRLTPAEIRDLQLTTEYETGKALTIKAELLQRQPALQPPVIAAAEKSLTASWNHNRQGELGQRSLILLATCARLRIDAGRAFKFLAEVEQLQPDRPIRDLVLIERVRVLLVQQKPVEAADLLQTEIKSREEVSAELLALRIELLLTLWESALDKQEVELERDLQKSIDEELQRLQQIAGGYWTVYAETRIARSRETRQLGPELASQVARARELYSQRDLPAAIVAYREAAERAGQLKLAAAAFDLHYTEGSLQIALQDFASAQSTFQQLVDRFPSNIRTPDAHYLACHAASQIYQQSATRQNREAYTQLLEEHRKRFPTHATWGEATWLLGQLEEQRLQNSAAIQVYQQLPASHPRFMAAQAAMARCYDRLIQRLRQLQQPSATWESEAVEKLRPVLSSPAGDFSMEQAVVGLHLCNILLQQETPDFASADQWLEKVIESARHRQPMVAATGARQEKTAPATASSPWKEIERAATRLRIISLAGQERYAAAEHLLSQLKTQDPAELLAMIDGLSPLVANAQAAPRHQLGELQLRAALSLIPQRDKLPPADQRRLQRCLAEAYVAAGRYDDALQPYRDLLQEQPRDAELSAQYARLLMKFDTPQQTLAARQIWKQVEGLYKPGTKGWLQSRLEYIRCDLRLGNAQAALKLIGVTRVLYPELGGEDLKSEFDDLAQQCRTQLAG